MCYLRPDCAVVALGPQFLAAHRFVTFERELPAQRRGGRDHRFVVIDRCDVDKSHRFHATGSHLAIAVDIDITFQVENPAIEVKFRLAKIRRVRFSAIGLAARTGHEKRNLIV